MIAGLGLFSVRSRDGTGDPFLILADPDRCPLNPIFDKETENAGFTSSKVRFGELQLENGLLGPVFEHLRPVTTNVYPSDSGSHKVHPLSEEQPIPGGNQRTNMNSFPREGTLLKPMPK